MKKMFVFLLTSALPLTIFLNQANYSLQTQKMIKGEWIENEQLEKEILNSPKKIINHQNIYSNNQIDINLTKNDVKQTIAQIYAKKVQKKYYLSLENDNYYNDNQLTNYIKKKFYSDKTTEYFLSSKDYFAFFDTSNDHDGKIINDGELGFKSSWGKINSNKSEGKFVFNLQEKTLKTHLIYCKNHNEAN